MLEDTSMTKWTGSTECFLLRFQHVCVAQMHRVTLVIPRCEEGPGREGQGGSESNPT